MNSTKKPIVELKNVSVHLNSKLSLRNKYTKLILNDINFKIYSGDSLGIIGQNGSGKSTILNLLAGILNPNSGQIINYAKKTALLSLGVGFDPFLTGRVNAILNGMYLGFSKKEITDKLEKIIEFTELQEFIDFPLHTYSTGMQARLSFAVASYLDTEILLIDEVLGVGDYSFNSKSTKILKNRINSDKTVVLVSHHNDTLRELCNRLIWIDDTKIKLDGKTEEVLNSYITSQQESR